MKTKESKNQNKESKDPNDEIPEKSGAEAFVSELREPRWSIVSFEKRTAKNLTYAEAERQIAKMKKQEVSGLCIITDEAAERIYTANASQTEQ